MNVYRSNAQSPLCEHAKLLNRGCPPNTSNQRVCARCGQTFDPPLVVNGWCLSNDPRDPHSFIRDQG